MLSGTAQYALRAVLYLAEQAAEAPVAAADIAAELDIPDNYLSKILHQLGRAGVLTSARGKHGGFRLAISPGDLTILEVVRQFDPIEEDPRCLLGRPECSDTDPCRAHRRWKEVALEVAEFFANTTAADLLQTSKQA
ncbi:MAG: Rrf2 family transcriptional regulator [Gemmatimonadota bacterium]|nr:MAG: Rrf2 family transcriptional regulator [Gemmatimonadota bacterium]